jgi:hypothetical protein
MSDKSKYSERLSISSIETDPLRVIPNIELSLRNISIGICVSIALILIAYSLVLHFSNLNATYYREIATVTYVDCNRFPVNNHRDEYHCVVGIKYPTYPNSTKMTENSLTFIDSDKFFEGDQFEIMIDRTNPLNIEVRVISDHNLAIIYFVCGLLLLIIATGIKFMRFV